LGNECLADSLYLPENAPMDTKTQNEDKRVAKPFIVTERLVVVECVGFRGLARQNKFGIWRSFEDNKRLPKDVHVVCFN
jgi:hypothetical protein